MAAASSLSSEPTLDWRLISCWWSLAHVRYHQVRVYCQHQPYHHTITDHHNLIHNSMTPFPHSRNDLRSDIWWLQQREHSLKFLIFILILIYWPTLWLCFSAVFCQVVVLISKHYLILFNALKIKSNGDWFQIGIFIVYFLDNILGSGWWVMVLYLVLLFAVMVVRGKPYGAEQLVSTLFPKKACCSSWIGPLLAFTWNVVSDRGTVSLYPGASIFTSYCKENPLPIFPLLLSWCQPGVSGADLTPLPPPEVTNLNIPATCPAIVLLPPDSW